MRIIRTVTIITKEVQATEITQEDQEMVIKKISKSIIPETLKEIINL